MNSAGLLIAGPSKEQVRDWLRERHDNRRPLPDRAQLARDLGLRAPEHHLTSPPNKEKNGN